MIRLKNFTVEGVKLKMNLFPNGDWERTEDHVSLYIENLSDHNISILFDLRIGNKRAVKDETFHIKAGDSFGDGMWYYHRNHHRGHRAGYRDDEEDQDYEIILTVKKLWKEMKENDAENNLIETLISLEKNLHLQVKKSFEDLGKAGEESLKDLERSVRNIVTPKLFAAPEAPTAAVPYPECPICLEKMTPETRIMQCGAGHLLCQACHRGLVAPECPSCKQPITGRCHGMEEYLTLIFPSKHTDKNGNKDCIQQ